MGWGSAGAIVELVDRGGGSGAAWAVVGALCGALLRRPVVASRRGTTAVLTGGGPDVEMAAGILSTRAHPTPKPLRAATLAEAQALAEAVAGDTIVIGRTTTDRPEPVVGAPKRRVTIVAAGALVEELLGRVPLDLAECDPWFTAVGATRPLPNGYRTAKRAVDVGLAGVVLAVASPLMALVALALWLERRGPVLTRQAAVGRGGEPFTFFRFRTAEPSGLAPTRVGLAVRRTHLDQLPALASVLRGRLSLIGPRPKDPHEVARRSTALPLYHRRHAVQPGLASWALVRFRATDAHRDTRLALEYDLYYVKHASPLLDLRVFVRAVLMVAVDGLAAAATLGAVGGRWLVLRGRRIERAFGRTAAMGSVALPRWAPGGATPQATLIVGAGEAGRRLAGELRRNPAWGIWPVGFVDDDPTKLGTRVQGLPVLGPSEALPALVAREHVEAVVIAIPSASEVDRSRLTDLARRSTARILAMPHLAAILTGEQSALSLQAARPTDVLGRDVVLPDLERCRSFLAGRRVLVTGAAGSIGRELIRQAARMGPAELIGLDVNESDLFDVQVELAACGEGRWFRAVIGSITNRRAMAALFAAHRPEVVFHAAAYKHVPLMEDHPEAALLVNAVGSFDLARAAAAAGVERFVLVSTDKAVRPISVMGASKRLAELATRAVAQDTGLSVCAVRFGNVLASRGSVVPVFEKQIAAGGPVTVTHPEVRRYFMTIEEAVGLTIQAGAFGDRDVIYVLDMGEEVAIRDLAERLIRLRGLRVGEDIDIVYTGLRPGEKLREELSLDFEQARPTPHPKIRILADGPRPTDEAEPLSAALLRLSELCRGGDPEAIRRALLEEVARRDAQSAVSNPAGQRSGA